MSSGDEQHAAKDLFYRKLREILRSLKLPLYDRYALGINRAQRRQTHTLGTLRLLQDHIVDCVIGGNHGQHVFLIRHHNV